MSGQSMNFTWAAIACMACVVSCGKPANQSKSANRPTREGRVGPDREASAKGRLGSHGSRAPKPLDERGKWACGKDSDCMNSCSHGAVSRTWYQAQRTRFSECMDGCSNQISGAPKCVKGQCVAFDNKGMRRDYCTRKRPRSWPR